jgi:hypothetical protein
MHFEPMSMCSRDGKYRYQTTYAFSGIAKETLTLGNESVLDNLDRQIFDDLITQDRLQRRKI